MRGAAVQMKAEVTEEQIAYAKFLDLGMKTGLLILLLTFGVYVFGVLEPHVQPQRVIELWGMPVQDYLRQIQVPPGWGWLAFAHKGDFLNFVGIAVLAAVTIGCFIRIVPILFRRNDTVYGIIAIAEVLVLSLAASGLLRVGGH